MLAFKNRVKPSRITLSAEPTIRLLAEAAPLANNKGRARQPRTKLRAKAALHAMLGPQIDLPTVRAQGGEGAATWVTAREGDVAGRVVVSRQDCQGEGAGLQEGEGLL
jgi:hypothetical protein